MKIIPQTLLPMSITHHVVKLSKTAVLTCVAMSLFFNVFAQTTKHFEYKPKNMSFVPQGNFQMQVIEGSLMYDYTVTVDAFWMSNEVTNAEYREYVNYAKQHSNEDVCWVNLEDLTSSKETKIQPETIKQRTTCVKYSEILADIIDTTRLPFADYFTSKKYNDYPVVGVSQRHATYYCSWKTKMENDALKKTGKPAIQNYRLPLEAEWMYVASQSKELEKTVTRNQINPSVSNRPNKWGLYNLADNVSEWTSSYYKGDAGKADKDLKIVKGGAYTTSSSIDERKALDQNSKEPYIGFRIVRSVVGNNIAAK